MLGLLSVSILLIYTAFWTWIALRFRSKAARAVVALVAFLVPTWDYFPQQYYFHKLCKAEAGQHLYAEPVKVDGFYDETMGFQAARRFIENVGYKYVEIYGYESGKRKLMRVERNADGRIVQTSIDSAISRYEFQAFTEARPWSLYAGGSRIVDLYKGEIAAESVGIYQGSTWVFRTLVPKGAPSSGEACFGLDPKTARPLLSRFLSPLQTTHEMLKEHE